MSANAAKCYSKTKNTYQYNVQVNDAQMKKIEVWLDADDENLVVGRALNNDVWSLGDTLRQV